MAELKNRTITKVRFSEVDSLGIVWHGHYIKYFEDGREAFGKEYGLGYMEVYANGFATVLVNINVDFKQIVSYEDNIIIETIYIPTKAAKIHFEFKIYKEKTNELVATGSSTQVFCTHDKKLHITNPPFYEKWKNENLK